MAAPDLEFRSFLAFEACLVLSASALAVVCYFVGRQNHTTGKRDTMSDTMSIASLKSTSLASVFVALFDANKVPLSVQIASLDIAKILITERITEGYYSTTHAPFEALASAGAST